MWKRKGTTFKFDIDQLVGDMAITPGGLLNCHFMYLTIQWPRNSVDAMSNMFGKMKHRLGIILKFQIKKVSVTVKMMIQYRFFNKMILIKLLECILCPIHWHCYMIFMLYSPPMAEKCERCLILLITCALLLTCIVEFQLPSHQHTTGNYSKLSQSFS